MQRDKGIPGYGKSDRRNSFDHHEPENQTQNANEANYLKAGTTVTVSAVLNERIQKISDANRKKIIASLNIKRKTAVR